MHFITNTYTKIIAKYGKTKAVVGLIIIAFVVIFVARTFTSTDSNNTASEATVAARSVSLYTISTANNGTAIRTADGNAFIIRAEAGGRLERIAKVGDIVAKGAIVAQVENSAQRATVLQAQGAYEAALAASQQSAVGQVSADQKYDEAVTQAENTVRSAFSTTDAVLHNTVDTVFTNPDSGIIGFRLSKGDTSTMNQMRKDLREPFEAWRTLSQSTASKEVDTLLDVAEQNTSKLNTLIITLTSILSDDSALDDASELADLRSNFATARSSVAGVLSSLSGARSALLAAKAEKEQAKIAGADSGSSLANAQVKQALGVLESARAALGKTSVKTPVAGTVTAVSISVGDIINIGSDVVFVSGDTTEQVEDSVTVPLTAVKFTPSKAFIFTVNEGKLVAHEVQTGSVTASSIAISGTEGITDIVLDIRGLKDGDAVDVQ